MLPCMYNIVHSYFSKQMMNLSFLFILSYHLFTQTVYLCRMLLPSTHNRFVINFCSYDLNIHPSANVKTN